jgi:hypothetical protein
MLQDDLKESIRILGVAWPNVVCGMLVKLRAQVYNPPQDYRFIYDGKKAESKGVNTGAEDDDGDKDDDKEEGHGKAAQRVGLLKTTWVGVPTSTSYSTSSSSATPGASLPASSSSAKNVKSGDQSDEDEKEEEADV